VTVSLRGRLFAGYVAVALVASVAFLQIAGPAQERWLVERAAASLERVAALSARDIANRSAVISPARPDWPAEAESLAAIVGLRVTLIAPDGAVVGDSELSRGRLATVENHAAREEVRAALSGAPGHTVRRSATLGIDLIYVAVPARAPGLAVLRVAQPLTAIAELNASLLRLSAGTVAATFLIMLLGVSWLTSRHARRIDALRGIADRVRAGDLHARALELPGDELGRLGRAINEMASELQRRLEALERERDERERILAHMSDGVALIDADSRFLHANQRFAALLGAPLPARGGTAFQDYARAPELRELIHSARRLGHTVEIETRLWSPPQRFVRASATPIGVHDRASVLLVLHDLTDIEELNRVRQDFVANVSHELRTPLTSLRGYAETLLDGGLDDIEHREGFVRTIRDQAARLSALVEDLLSLAELEGRGAGLRAETFDLREVIEQQMAAFRPRAEAAGLGFTFEPGPPLTVAADRLRIEQAVANLLDNATKYTERGEVRVRAGSGGMGAWVEVHDTGPGIPEGDRPRVFERFYRVDKARSREKGGTGLGLSIVKHAIALHGGRVSVESGAGKGSVFRFEIPAERKV
jgi:two-component system phosphate regulon sensor histidine kinase PhoR